MYGTVSTGRCVHYSMAEMMNNKALMQLKDIELDAIQRDETATAAAAKAEAKAEAKEKIKALKAGIVTDTAISVLSVAVVGGEVDVAVTKSNSGERTNMLLKYSINRIIVLTNILNPIDCR